MNYPIICIAFLVILVGSSAPSEARADVQPIATSAPPSANQLTPHPADAQNLAELLAELFPDRKDDKDPSAYDDLLSDFQHFGLLTVEDIHKVISANRRATEEEDARQAEPYDDGRKNAKETSAGRRQWFNRVGMARNTLEKHVGREAYANYSVERPPRPPRKPASRAQPGATASNAKTIRTVMRAQFDEISNYFVNGFFNSRAEVEKKHLIPLKKYISENMSYESFEKEMIEADKQFAKHGGRPMDLDAVVENEPLDDQAVFLTTVSQMAAINAFNHLSVYQHEFISPTDVQKSLFAKENDFERKVFISAITDDVPLRKFKKQFPKTKVDDQQAKIFHFRTPKFTWGSYSEERDTLSSSTIRLLR